MAVGLDEGSGSSETTKLSRKQWRALKRKEKRKITRQAEGKERHCTVDKSPSSASSDEDKTRAAERVQQQQHLLWLERERQAQAEWQLKKEREEKEKQRIEEQKRQIQEEWEERERQEKEEREKRELAEKERREKQEALLKEATANENKKGDGAWHNPIAPMNYGREQLREYCPFFRKVGACRFGDRCSRAHPEPEHTTTLLFPGMYTHFELTQGLHDEYDTDVGLEYEEGETYQHFKDFYRDALPEFKRVGRVVQFKVCCNYEPHLRGNVYVQFSREEDAQAAYAKFNGRYYGGRQLSAQFVSVEKWRLAICGLYGRHKCPKGKNCNFLHVFRNPDNEFRDADFDFERSGRGDRRSERYESSRFVNDRHRNGKDSYRHDDRARRRSRSRSRERVSVSQSHDRSRSQSHRSSRSKSYRRSRSRDRYKNSSDGRRQSKRRSRSRSKLKSRSRSRSRERSERQYSRSPENYPRKKKRRRSKSRSRSPSKSIIYIRDPSFRSSKKRQQREITRSPSISVGSSLSKYNSEDDTGDSTCSDVSSSDSCAIATSTGSKKSDSLRHRKRKKVKRKTESSSEHKHSNDVESESVGCVSEASSTIALPDSPSKLSLVDEIIKQSFTE